MDAPLRHPFAGSRAAGTLEGMRRHAVVAQLAERGHGKTEVEGSNPSDGSMRVWRNRQPRQVEGLVPA